jgi:hypothetical protein
MSTHFDVLIANETQSLSVKVFEAHMFISNLTLLTRTILRTMSLEFTM